MLQTRPKGRVALLDAFATRFPLAHHWNHSALSATPPCLCFRSNERCFNSNQWNERHVSLWMFCPEPNYSRLTPDGQGFASRAGLLTHTTPTPQSGWLYIFWGHTPRARTQNWYQIQRRWGLITSPGRPLTNDGRTKPHTVYRNLNTRTVSTKPPKSTTQKQSTINQEPNRKKKYHFFEFMGGWVISNNQKQKQVETNDEK